MRRLRTTRFYDLPLRMRRRRHARRDVTFGVGLGVSHVSTSFAFNDAADAIMTCWSAIIVFWEVSLRYILYLLFVYALDLCASHDTSNLNKLSFS